MTSRDVVMTSRDVVMTSRGVSRVHSLLAIRVFSQMCSNWLKIGHMVSSAACDYRSTIYIAVYVRGFLYSNRLVWLMISRITHSEVTSLLYMRSRLIVLK